MSEVLTEVRDGVLIITLNRPEAKNAANRALAEGVAAALDTLDGADTLRVGIITGAGGTFCSGMDLKAFLQGELPSIKGRGFAGLTEAPPKKPLIAAVDGYALAGGFEIMLACDLSDAFVRSRCPRLLLQGLKCSVDLAHHELQRPACFRNRIRFVW